MNQNQSTSGKDAARQMKNVIELLRASRFDEAKVICEQILQGDADNVDAIYALGWIALYQKNMPTALEAFNRVIALKPDHSRAHNNLGWILMQSSDALGATKYFEAAIALEPSLREAYANLGACLLILAKHQEARDVFQKAIDLVPDDSMMRANLAAINHLTGEQSELLPGNRTVT